MRKSLLLNGTLFNSEAWHGLIESQLAALAKVDEDLIKRMAASHSKIHVTALYLETGTIPVRYILACRPILYLKFILHRSKDKLIKKVYLAQQADIREGDFCQLMDGDMWLIDVLLSDCQIESISSYDLKKIVKIIAKKLPLNTSLKSKKLKGK